MRLLSPLLFVLLIAFKAAPAQKSPAKEPFIIRGQLMNFTEKDLMFFFRDPETGLKDHTIETVTVDSMGRFYLKTYAISGPTRATLRKGEFSVDVYAAQGYNLTLTGDVKDTREFMIRRKVFGVGAESNQYLLALDKIMYASRDTLSWNEMNETQLLRYVEKDKHIRDSLYSRVFGKNDIHDKWQKAFAKLTMLDNEFLQAYYVLNHVTYDSTFDYARSASFLEAHTNPKLWQNLYNAENLISENYITWFMGTYSEYLRRQAARKSRTKLNENGDIELVKEIATHYKGQIREIKLFTKIKNTITFCRSFEELEEYKNKMPAYIALLKSKTDQEKLTELLSDREIELIQAQIGKSAPLFEVADSSGVLHKLSDYLGKVVYLDFWASWCGPCRAEMPHFKDLIKKYESNSDVAFISVAVMDKLDKWLGALKKDVPSGLQLYDTDGIVQKRYFVSSIPKFILINKKGEIVTFDAPAPSNAAALEPMLDKEIKID